MSTIVIYESGTGFTEQYANWLAQDIGAECTSLKQTGQIQFEKYDQVIFGGWIMGGMIVGLTKQISLRKPDVIFAVGTTPAYSEVIDSIRNTNPLEDIPFFYLQGGIRMDRLGFMKRFILKTLGKKVSKKELKNRQEEFMAQTLGKSVDYSSHEQLSELLQFLGEKFDRLKVVKSACGINCDKCRYKTKTGCKGCIAVDGKPFWTEATNKSCEVAACVKERKILFCGECADFPCELLEKCSYDEKEGDNGVRIENCKQWKRTLVETARRGKNSIGYCGHHCDHCFLGEWCGGCRSDYNCCSYATLFEDGKCPNIVCAKAKGIEGCYECDFLAQCKKGYYEKEEGGEFAAKAAASFIHLHGKDAYNSTLDKMEEEGVEYQKALDEAGSVDGAQKILEKYYNK